MNKQTTREIILLDKKDREIKGKDQEIHSTYREINGRDQDINA